MEPKKTITIESFAKTDRLHNPAPSRGLVFETERQRNAAFIDKGITKPGRISYTVLRRAAMSVHVARICINVLKEKITKTKWVIKPIDGENSGEDDDARIKKVTEFFRHPNGNDETFRTLMDKMLEDLLVLDAVAVEKTRYPNGQLAELFFIDAATIRPVFDEFGNQDIPIPLATKDEGMKELPVSYVQVMNNSQYGGPESGEIVAAWAKKDFIYFHMHPQGAMEGIGYGLSPLEGVLSVVANILNADNYNGSYFEEGSFPPVILQIMGQIGQREVEAYREYLQSELNGNFHRPAILAGGTDAKVLNLKDLSNRDMEFMEYMKFMSRLLAAAYGLSGQDIGITEEVGSKNVSETMNDLSNQKGYGSILHLLKEVFNQEIIWKDFGYDDLEFDWVVEDTTNAKDLADILTKHLQAGLITLNEARIEIGKQPFGEWADVPSILTTSGFIKAGQLEDPEEEEKKLEPTDKEEVGGEKVYHDQKEVPEKEYDLKERPSSKKSMVRLKKFFKNFITSSTPAVTPEQAYDKEPVLFGELFVNGFLQESVRELFRFQSVGVLVENGLRELQFTYDFNQATKGLGDYLISNPGCYGGIVRQQDEAGIKYLVYVQ